MRSVRHSLFRKWESVRNSKKKKEKEETVGRWFPFVSSGQTESQGRIRFCALILDFDENQNFIGNISIIDRNYDIIG